MAVRLDKWLQVARMFKSRSQATRACQLNRVRINGERAKPHRALALGDRIEVEKGDRLRILVVSELADKPLPKAEVPRIYVDESPPVPPPDPMARLLRRPPVQREAGAGRPTKKQRREIERLRS